MKKIVLLGSLLGSICSYLFSLSTKLILCDKLDYSCRTNVDRLEHVLYFFVVISFFSLITYKMPSRVFSAWWKFARISAPVILVISAYIVFNPKNSGGFFNMDNEARLIQLSFLYLIFIVGSFIQIYRSYRNK